LIALGKVYKEFQEKKTIAAKNLCKLLDDHRKEEYVAKHFNRIIRTSGRDVNMEEFINVIGTFFSFFSYCIPFEVAVF
jgi:hypothetical protein